MDACEKGVYEIHITALSARPSDPPISRTNKAVIISDCCKVFIAVMDILRHTHGIAYICPAGQSGPVTAAQRALGDAILDEIGQFAEERLQAALMRMTAPLN